MATDCSDGALVLEGATDTSINNFIRFIAIHYALKCYFEIILD